MICSRVAALQEISKRCLVEENNIRFASFSPVVGIGVGRVVASVNGHRARQ
jgi:hypothetical protein